MKLKPKLKEKRWKVENENLVWKKWLKENIFKFNPKTHKPIFTIDTPPPYPRSA
jgi:valyl-tRNA synthetase